MDQNNLLEAEVEQVTKERNLYHEETLNLSSQLKAARQEVTRCEELLEEKVGTQRQLVTDLTKQVQAGVYMELDHSKLPNMSNLNPELMKP